MGRKKKDVPDLCRRKDGSLYVSDPTRLTPAGKPTQLRIRDRQHYEDFRRDYLARADQPRPATPIPLRCDIETLCEAFLEHAQTYYRKSGRSTGVVGAFEAVAKYMMQVWGGREASSLRAADMEALQTRMVASGLARSTVNSYSIKARTIVRWGVKKDAVDGAALERLRSVPAVKKNRTTAREPGKVRPVPLADVEATLPKLRPRYRAIARLQLYAGARPGETCGIQLRWIDRSGKVWIYSVPEDLDKTAHHRRPGEVRKVYFGPKAQEILRPMLTMPPNAPLFRLRSGRAQHPRAYRDAVHRACARAGVPMWSPGQLRHTMATEVRARYGLDAAQSLLGHENAEITEGYAELRDDLALKVAAEMG